MVILETPRLIVRGFTLEDVPLAYKYSQEECTKNELPDEVFDGIEGTKEKLLFLIENYKKNIYPLVYALELRGICPNIGHVSLSTFGKNDENIEVGYAIATEYQGNGYASEVVRPFTEWAKRSLHLDKIYGEAKTTNIASWRILEKAGFQFIDEKVRNSFWGTYLTRMYIF